MSTDFNADNIAVSLMEDVKAGRLRQTDLLEACLTYMSEDQILKMALEEGFIYQKEDDDKEDRIHYDDLTAQDRIIEKILARHGGS